MSKIESAVANVQQIGGNCDVAAAFTKCNTELFPGDAGSRARVLVVLLAGKSEYDVSKPANSLKTFGVKIIAVGMGGSFDQFDLSSMAYSPSYILSVTAVSNITSLKGSLTTLILQGNCFKLHFCLVTSVFT